MTIEKMLDRTLERQSEKSQNSEIEVLGDDADSEIDPTSID